MPFLCRRATVEDLPEMLALCELTRQRGDRYFPPMRSYDMDGNLEPDTSDQYRQHFLADALEKTARIVLLAEDDAALVAFLVIRVGQPRKFRTNWLQATLSDLRLRDRSQEQEVIPLLFSLALQEIQVFEQHLIRVKHFALHLHPDAAYLDPLWEALGFRLTFEEWYLPTESLPTELEADSHIRSSTADDYAALLELMKKVEKRTRRAERAAHMFCEKLPPILQSLRLIHERSEGEPGIDGCLMLSMGVITSLELERPELWSTVGVELIRTVLYCHHHRQKSTVDIILSPFAQGNAHVHDNFAPFGAALGKVGFSAHRRDFTLNLR